jgi:hypothetical protein
MTLQIDGENEPKSLSYTEAFMFAETVWPKAESGEPSPLKPTHNFDWDSMFKAYNRQSWKGFCCESCGRLSCRIYWDRFECANKECKLAVVPKGRKSFLPEDLSDGVPRTGPAIALNVAKDEIEVTKTNLDGYTVMQYKLGDAGTVTHMVANLPLNAVEFGADWLFQEYQQSKIPFMRHPMHTIQGLTRTAHFTYNVGAQYNYVTEQSTVSFEEAPPVVTKALELIKSNVKKIYPYVRFNEVLNVGYFEQQRMGVSNPTSCFIIFLIPKCSSIKTVRLVWDRQLRPCLWVVRPRCCSASKPPKHAKMQTWTIQERD